jgi:hypothetical protein
VNRASETEHPTITSAVTLALQNRCIDAEVISREHRSSRYENNHYGTAHAGRRMVTSVKHALLLIALSSSAVAVADDGIKVRASGGQPEATTAENQPPAIVIFDADERIVVRKIGEEMAVQTTTNAGYNASTFGDVSRALCSTPCTLEMPPGFLRVRFGDANPMNANKPIDFDLRPGENRFRVEPFKGGKFVAGFLMTILGGTAAIVGTSMGIIDADVRVPMLVMAGAGAGVTIGGVVLIVGSRASAERVPTRDPSIR